MIVEEYDDCFERFLEDKGNEEKYSDLLPELSLPIISWKQGFIEERDLSTSFDNFQRDIQFINKLGSGMFGNVHKALFKNQIVAVKTLSEDNPTKDDLISFCKEVGILSSLKHPNIVQLLYFYPKPMSIITEFIEGGDLQNQMKFPSKFNWKIIAKIALDISIGLSYMHCLNPPILHCDLKTANILVVDIEANHPNLAVKIADVGCARLANHLGEGGSNDLQTELLGFIEILNDIYECAKIYYSPVPPVFESIFKSLKDLHLPSPIFHTISQRFLLIVEGKVDFKCENFTDKMKIKESLIAGLQQNNNNKREVIKQLKKLKLTTSNENSILLSDDLLKVIEKLLKKSIKEGDNDYFFKIIQYTKIDLNYTLTSLSLSSHRSQKCKLLHLVIRYGKLTILNRMINEGAIIHFISSIFPSPIQVAIYYNHPNLISFFSDSLSLNQINFDGHSAFTLAVEMGRFDCIRELLRLSVSPTTGVNSSSSSFPSFNPLKLALKLKNNNNNNNNNKNNNNKLDKRNNNNNNLNTNLNSGSNNNININNNNSNNNSSKISLLKKFRREKVKENSNENNNLNRSNNSPEIEEYEYQIGINEDRDNICKLLLESGAEFPSQNLDNNQKNYLNLLIVELFFYFSNSNVARHSINQIYCYLNTAPEEDLLFISERVMILMMEKYAKSKLVRIFTSRDSIILPNTITHSFTSYEEKFQTKIQFLNVNNYSQSISLIVPFNNKISIQFRKINFKIKARLTKSISCSIEIYSIEKKMNNLVVIVEVEDLEREKLQYYLLPVILKCSDELLQLN